MTPRLPVISIRTHSQVLSEVQFCNTFARCCIAGMSTIPALQEALPSADAKLGALLPRLGFGSRKDLLSFLHAKANGGSGKGATGAGAVTDLLREHGVDVAALSVGHGHGHAHGPLAPVPRPNRGGSLPGLGPASSHVGGSRAGSTKDPSGAVPPSRQVDGYMLPLL